MSSNITDWFARRPAPLWIAVAALSLAACSSDDTSSDSDGADPGPQVAEPKIVDLKLAPDEGEAKSLAVGEQIRLVATAIYDDDDERKVTDTVEWTVDDDGVLAMIDDGLFEGRSVGEVTITATLGDQSAEIALEVQPAALLEIRLTPSTDVIRLGIELQLTAEGVYADGTEVDITDAVTWATSDEVIALVSDDDAKGRVRVVGIGAAEIVASLDDREARFEVAADCDYPEGGVEAFEYGTIMPAFRWDGAYRPDGSQFDLDLKHVYCSAEYDDITVIAFLMGAGWCPACTDYTQRLSNFTAAFREAGGLLIFVEVQTASYEPSSNEYAHQHITRLIGDGEGIRVGDAETQPRANTFLSNPNYSYLPSAVVARRRDMRIIADQKNVNFMLPYPEIAADPEADWSNPAAPPFISHCEDGDDELSEPNDTREDAAVVVAGDVIEGGICDFAPDFYKIEHDGPWRARLEFSHADGDLDMYMWHPLRDEPLQVNGRQVSSDSTTDNEMLEFDGNGILRVGGFNGASATYRLTIEAI